MKENGTGICQIADQFKTTRQTIYKYLNLYQKVKNNHCVTMRMNYMFKDQLCTEIDIDFKNEKIYISVKDTGKGVPELVVQNMDNQTDKVHIMGLRLARQIVRAHGGELIFEKRESGTYDVTLELSVSKLHP